MSVSDRRKLFRDPLIQKVIEVILRQENRELTPSYEASKGFYYDKIDEIFGDVYKSELALKQMSDSGILDKKFFDTGVVCPNCRSSQISLLYRCPKCNSAMIESKSLCEHVKCGAIDVIDRFKKEDEYECFQCKASLMEGSSDLKNIGSWFICSSCNFRFDEPLTIQRCMSCKNEFLPKDAKLKSLFLYVMNEAVKSEYERELALLLLLKPEIDKLKSKAEMMSVIQGKSGTSYEFDVATWSKGAKKPTVVDVVMNNEPIGTGPITSMFAKIYDVEPSRQILVAIPDLQEDSVKLAKLYKIEILTAKTMEEAVSKLIAILKD
ncbi:MAG: hypothetical protein NWE86_01010 [Candidatus Bathyarchaeota archaeon]|nr:hypothetical protein [Candidatus Bathyarchaeota archaeon]